MEERREIFKTYHDVFDKSTIQSIWELITHKKIEGLESPVKVGKESNIFTALTKDNQRVAVKIYRLTTCDFFKMSKYLSMDHRFRQVRRRKQVVLTWARREYSNLLRAYKAGVNVPRPIALQDNVMIMEFIGENHANPRPAPLVKSVEITEEIAREIINETKKLYKAGLVHGDLSEFNILYTDKPIIIDLSHSVPVLSTAAEELLERDAANLSHFLSKQGIKTDKDSILNEIKGN